MHILELPAELIHKILLQAVFSRGVVRGLRLKLVCKRFCSCLPRALFESRLLDEFQVLNRYNNLELMEKWQIRKHHGANEFWQSYLTYRVQNEADPRVGRFVEIRKIAEELCHHTGAEYKTAIDTMCWLALERGSRCAPGHFEAWKTPGRAEEASNPDLNLLSVAAYLGHVPLVKRLLQQGCCPTEDNDLFPSPMGLATWAGRVEILKLFQEHLPEFEDVSPRFQNSWCPSWRGKTGPGSIKGAALRGDMNILRLAVYPPSRARSDSKDFAGKSVGHVDPMSKQGQDLRDALYCAKTPEMFQYIHSFFERATADTEFLLGLHAELGNLDMVQYILDTSGQIRKQRSNADPLVIAARYWQENIVDLLLERGADPNDGRLQQRGTPLTAAASARSMAIVRKLINAGANGIHDDVLPLKRAVLLEHTAMVKLFLDMDIGHPWQQVLRYAKKEGLESMAQLLEQRGVRLD